MRTIVLGFIRFYQLTFSALLGRQCRFLPTCSEYSAEAIRLHGLWFGISMGTYRLLRCRPGCCGGYDPVPENLDPTIPWFMPWRQARPPTQDKAEKPTTLDQ